MAGGAPAGIIKLPGEEGCLTINTIMRIMTRHGNKSTAPSGTEIFEFPLRRIRRLKKDSLGMSRSFSLLRSEREGIDAAEGIRFVRPCMRPIVGQ